MKRLLFLMLLSVPCCIIESQVPQGFNYQAIARDDSNNPITDPIGVRFTIQSDSLGGTVFWVEEHFSVTPNESGIINVVIGKGNRIAGLPKFSDIDWTVKPKFIMVHIDHEGWKLMGSARLWAVPYAMVADSLGGPLKKLSVVGVTTNMEEALFEVKNTAGKTVFAVYNEGVRVYVADGDTKGVKGGFAVGSMVDSKAEDQNYLFVSGDSIRAYVFDDPLKKAVKGGFAISGFSNAKKQTDDYLLVSPDSVRVFIDKASSTKALKGGFAVSGFGNAKADKEEYLRVSRDSTRIYINDLPGKAVKGGFAVSGFGNAKGAANFLNVATDANDIIDPSKNIILWYPLKNAFLTGKVLIQKPDSVGENSFASGFESKAKGMYSQAMGYKTIARGDYSTAIGKNAVADKTNSFAFGENSSAKNIQTYSFGYGSQANAIGSFALGYNSKTTGQDAFAIGSGTEAIGQGSFAIGFIGRDSAGIATGNTRAEAAYAVAIGMGAQAKKDGAFSIGTKSIANGAYSVALGYKTNTSGVYSTSMGAYTTSSGYSSLATGNSTTATNDYATATGHRTSATGRASTAMGWGTLASGDYSLATGWYTTAGGNRTVSMGTNTTASGHNSIAMGRYSIASADGSIAIGDVATASGWCSIALGCGAKASGDFSIAMGNGIETSGDSSFGIALEYQDGIVISQPNTMSIMGGKVGIGSTSPGSVLSVYANNPGNYAMRIQNDGNSYTSHGLRISCGNDETSSNTTYAITFLDGDNDWVGSISIKDHTVHYNTTSDRRLKSGIKETVIEGIDIIKRIPVMDFSFLDSPEKILTGFIAQDVFSVYPEAVSLNEDGYYQLSYPSLIPVLAKAIQEQQQQIESYKSQLESLQEEVEQIKALLTNHGQPDL